MFVREIWGKFITFIFFEIFKSSVQKSELGKFIPSFSLKHGLLVLIFFIGITKAKRFLQNSEQVLTFLTSESILFHSLIVNGK